MALMICLQEVSTAAEKSLRTETKVEVKRPVIGPKVAEIEGNIEFAKKAFRNVLAIKETRNAIVKDAFLVVKDREVAVKPTNESTIKPFIGKKMFVDGEENFYLVYSVTAPGEGVLVRHARHDKPHEGEKTPLIDPRPISVTAFQVDFDSDESDSPDEIEVKMNEDGTFSFRAEGLKDSFGGGLLLIKVSRVEYNDEVK